MKKLSSFTISILVLSALVATPVMADLNVVNREEWKADESLVDSDDYKLGTANKIYVVGLTTPNKEVRINTDYWVRGLYYFFTTKTKFNDIPFNYFVGWDGEVYEGTRPGIDTLAPVKDENAIIIGYLSNYDSVGVTRLGQDNLKELLIKVSNEYSVHPEKIESADWSIVPTDDLQETLMTVSDETGDKIKAVLDEIRDDIKDSYAPGKRNYSAEIVSVQNPDQMSAEDIRDITVTVKNTGDTIWYKGGSDEITVAKDDGKDSLFSINDVWLSSSQVEALQEDVVSPGEEINLIFAVKAPLSLDEKVTEKFVLKTLDGVKLDGTEFTIEVEVDLSNLTIVEVQPTPTNYLNVRVNPSISSELITQIAPGERFISLEVHSGWHKIRLNDGSEGWVAGQYLKEL